jgi:hypothetical protein
MAYFEDSVAKEHDAVVAVVVAPAAAVVVVLASFAVVSVEVSVAEAVAAFV